MSGQGNAHVSEIRLSQVDKLVDAGDSTFLEHGDIAIHLDRKEPLVYRLALQGIGGAAVTVAMFLWRTFRRTVRNVIITTCSIATRLHLHGG